MEDLTDTGIERVLTDNGVGTLSLVDGETPYGFPVSFGYGDGEANFLFQMQESADSRKFAAMRSNQNASLSVYQQREGPPMRWESVILSGELYEIPENEEAEAFARLADNAVFAPNFDVFGVDPEEIDLHYFGLPADDISGRVYATHELYVRD